MERGLLPGPDPKAAADRWRGWLLAVEQKLRADGLERQLQAMRSSASWRLTAPLRSIRAWFGGKTSTQARLQPSRPAGEESPDLVALLDAIAARGMLPAWPMSTPPVSGRRLLLDVTDLASEDLGAGVQRVTRRIVGELLLQARPEFEVELVRLTARGTYARARQFAAALVHAMDGRLGEDVEIAARPGDILLGLDFCRAYHAQLDAALAGFRAAGALVVLLVHDVLPLQHPEWFPEPVSQDYEAWLRVLAHRSDAALCISMESARSLSTQLEARGLPLPRLGQHVIGLGSDGLIPGAPSLPARPVSMPAQVLVVGTIEPRKGHAQILDAFEQLWQQNVQVELTIAGKAGWMTEPLLERIRCHPMLGTKLRWLSAPDDLSLFDAYVSADLVLMASNGEGFGLPIAEGAWAGCDLLVRDIPVFRETAGPGANYFEGNDGSSLAIAVQAWLQDAGSPFYGTKGRKTTTWAECASVIKRLCIQWPAAAEPDVNAKNAKERQ